MSDAATATGMDRLLVLVKADAALPLIQQKAYLLATIQHECAGTWEPITERGQRSYFDKYDKLPLSKPLGNTQPGDGYLFRGRGYVQITGRGLYRKLGLVIGADLEANPDLALDHAISYRIISAGLARGLFTGRKLSDYISASKVDYINARRTVNSLDKASLIAEYAVALEHKLRD